MLMPFAVAISILNRSSSWHNKYFFSLFADAIAAVFFLHAISLVEKKHTQRETDTNAMKKIVLSFMYGWKSLEGFSLFYEEKNE